MTIISNIGASFANHASIFHSQRTANLVFIDNVNGKKATETRTFKDQIYPRFKSTPSAEQQITLFKQFAGWDTEGSKFPDGFDINAAIRKEGHQYIRWLDVSNAKAQGQVEDDGFIRFLLENGASLDDCLPETKASLQALAADIGYQAVGEISDEEIQEAVDTIRDAPNSAGKIAILKNLAKVNHGNAEAVPEDNPAGFLGKLDLNGIIRIQGGKEYTLLDLAAEISDDELALFLIEKDATQCSEETKTRFTMAFELYALKRRQAAENNANNTTITTATLSRADSITTIDDIDVSTVAAPSSVGSVTTIDDINTSAAAVRQRSLGGYLSKLTNPLCLAAVVAGATLYAPSILINGLISVGYVTGQGFASLAALPLHAADETISAGINHVRTSLGYEGTMDTRHYLTKTFGGLACLTALATVAICAVNPASYAVRFALSSAADLGTKLISYGLEGDQADEIIYETLKDFNNRLNQDMKQENWEQIGTFIGDVATKRGFRNNYERNFQDSNNPNPGLKSAIARFAMVPIPLYL